MVNLHRIDHILNRPLAIREGRIRRREQIRQRLIRGGTFIPRQLYIDTDDIPPEVETEETPFELSFAPLSLDTSDPPENHESDSSEEDSIEIIDDSDDEEVASNNYSERSPIPDSFFDEDTIIINPQDQNEELIEAVLNEWERRAEIPRDIAEPELQPQEYSSFTPPDSPEISPELSRAPTPMWGSYESPCYSPLTLEDIEEFERANLQREIEPLFSDPEDADMLADEYANALIDRLDRSIEEDED